MFLKKEYILNPAYTIRADEKRIILYKADVDPGLRVDVSDVLTVLHPLYASILSLFDGTKPLETIVRDLVNTMKLTKEEVLKIIAPLINNENDVQFEINGFSFYLPKKIIVGKEPRIPIRKFSMEDFLIHRDELDLTSWRLYRPLDAILMLNTSCLTDCIYCYANRDIKYNSRFTLGRIKEVIQEARTIGMRSIDVTGGEFFLYPGWQELLEELLKNGFFPYISTKIPLDLTTLKTLKQMGMYRIQISIDSVIPQEVQQVLNVKKDYLPKIQQTLRDLDRLGFEIYTNSQITNLNYKHIEDLLEFLLGLDNIRRISVGAAGFSLYKNNYYDYAISLASFQRIESMINQIKEDLPEHISLNLSEYRQSSDYLNDDQNVEFKKRARCSGNFFAFFVLPDGRVTICEELYNHPSLILGDLTRQSIMDMWNSAEAKGLYKLSKDQLKKENPCSVCDDFVSCRQRRGVCWKEVLYAYGHKNWDYPDPRCVMAPPYIREFCIK